MFILDFSQYLCLPVIIFRLKIQNKEESWFAMISELLIKSENIAESLWR